MSILVKLEALTSQQKTKVRNDLEVKPKSSYRGTVLPMFRFWEPRDNKHMAVPYYYGKFNLSNATIPNGPFPNYTIKFTSTLLPHQIKIAATAKQHLARYGTATLNLYTGFGKTVVCAYLSAHLKKITLVLCDNIVLLRQWKTTFEDFTDAVVWVVDDKLPVDNPTVIICMTKRMAKISEYLNKNVGTLIIDEAHSHCTAGKVCSILTTRPSYVIVATATIERRDKAHSMLEQLCGSHIIIEKSDKPFIVHCYETKVKVIPERNTHNNYDFNDLTNKLCESEQRNLLIAELVRANPGRKILILSWRAKHVDVLADLICRLPLATDEDGNPVVNDCGDVEYFKVDTMSGNKKTYQDSQVLIGTIAKIGKGFDEKTACDTFDGVRINLLILTGSISFMGLMEQVAGRCFRADYPNIIYLLDDAPIVKGHWAKAKAWFESVNGTVEYCSV